MDNQEVHLGLCGLWGQSFEVHKGDDLGRLGSHSSHPITTPRRPTPSPPSPWGSGARGDPPHPVATRLALRPALLPRRPSALEGPPPATPATKAFSLLTEEELAEEVDAYLEPSADPPSGWMDGWVVGGPGLVQGGAGGVGLGGRAREGPAWLVPPELAKEGGEGGYTG